jgi:mannose-6-phosphate isomerase
MLAPFKLLPEYRDYVWGGNRLRPNGELTAEAWVVYENDQIADGPLAGMSLAQAAAAEGESLLGRHALARTGRRFPLLIKLLDCAAWLSLQVHPNDEQAARLEGPGFFGKTEAWHIVEAAPQAELLCGFHPGVTPKQVAQAIEQNRLLELVQRLPVQAGDSLFIRPGMIHALGPGLLIYEVQQTSDLTYRVWDWDRPQTGNRKLHIEQSLDVLDASAAGTLIPPPSMKRQTRQELVACDYFRLELLASQGQPLALDTQGKSFHALTILEGAAQVEAAGQEHRLKRFETLLAPASCGAYQVRPLGALRALKAEAA